METLETQSVYPTNTQFHNYMNKEFTRVNDNVVSTETVECFNVLKIGNF